MFELKPKRNEKTGQVEFFTLKTEGSLSDSDMEQLRCLIDVCCSEPATKRARMAAFKRSQEARRRQAASRPARELKEIKRPAPIENEIQRTSK